MRTVAFMLCGSALWALLPLVARRELGLPSSGYGILLASLGLGAVAGAALLPRLRDRFSADARVGGATIVFGLTTLALGYVPNLPLVCALMAAAGAAWMVVTSGLNVMVQACVPKWVRARALGTYLLVFQGTLAVGSLVFGFVAERLGDPVTLAVAAVGLVLGMVATWRWRLEATEQLDLTPLHLLPEPVMDDAPDLDEGPCWSLPNTASNPSGRANSSRPCARSAACAAAMGPSGGVCFGTPPMEADIWRASWSSHG